MDKCSQENQESVSCTPDTLPLSLQSHVHSQEPDNTCWGHLMVMKINCTIDLIKECYKIGRGSKCEIKLDESFGHDCLKFSKVHFKIFLDEDCEENIPYIRDFSTNGTYVNRMPIGKNLKRFLTSGDEISLIEPNNLVFTFVGKVKQEEWLPLSLVNFYMVVKHLGSGGFADVKLVFNKMTGARYAMKKIKKDLKKEDGELREVEILKKIRHPCIIKLEEVIETPDSLCILLEYMPDGTLHSRIQSFKKIQEDEAKIIFYQLTKAVNYLHTVGITHRDLKPENILLCFTKMKLENKLEQAISIVKLTDFGLSKFLNSNTNLKTACGTKSYAAPEIFLSALYTGMPYSNKVDIWSLGVILFFCLCGCHPFGQEEDAIRRIIHAKYTMDHPRWHFISSNAKCIVKKMIVIDPNKRPSSSDIFEHPWIKDDSKINEINKFFNFDLKRNLEEDFDSLTQDFKKPKSCFL